MDADVTRAFRDLGAAPDPALEAVLLRWVGVASRLRLSEAAEGVGAAILRAELDSDDGVLTRDQALSLAVERGASPRGALTGLSELEARGAVIAWSEAPGAWQRVPLGFAARIREQVLGVAPADSRSGEPVPLPPRIEAHVVEIAATELDGTILVLRGRPGSGREKVLDGVLHTLDQPALVLTPDQLAKRDDRLEPEVSGRVVVWDARGCDPGPTERAQAGRWLARSAGLAVMLVDRGQDLPSLAGRRLVHLDLDPADREERAWIWRQALEPTDTKLAEELSEQLHVGLGHAVRVADALAGLPYASRTTAMARKILEDHVPPSAVRGIVVEHPQTTLDELVLDRAAERGVGYVASLAKHRGSIDSDRLGVKALLFGPPGTGKTLTARALACSLARPLYRVDLASVVSKWLGETEKNLARAFDAARAVGAVLLFDEGEALFGQRGEVSRGADRYANLEVAYLLQAIEEHDGLVVVTTNAKDKIDSAFLRRFDVVLGFDRPDAARRARLWRRELGDDGTVLPDAFVQAVARRGDLTGGHIAAAAHLARAIAREHGRAAVATSDVLEAVAFEHTKLGASVAASRFRKEMEREWAD